MLATPLTVTTTFPVVAPEGTATTRVVELQPVAVPSVPLNEIELLPCVVPKFVPVKVSNVPTPPELEERLVIFGVGSTVKGSPLLLTPLALTTTFPLEAPVGTAVTILVAFQLVIVAAVPLNETDPPPWLEPKLAPLIVTE